MRILSALMTEARGSVGGITIFPNQYHQLVVRARTNPVNPNTTRQQQIRGAFDDAQEAYNALTPAEQIAWDNYAASCTFVGPLGSYSIPGRQMFIRNYGTFLYLVARDANSFPATTDPPLLPGFNALPAFITRPLTAPGIGVEIVGTNPNQQSNTLYVYRSRAFDPSRRRFKGPFLTETIYPQNRAFGVQYIIPFTGLEDGMRYFFVLRMITDQEVAAGHRLSFNHVISALATTTP